MKKVSFSLQLMIITINLKLLGHVVPSCKGKGFAGTTVFPNTFISSRLAGKTPGLRFDSELFGRARDGGRGGGGGAVGKDTTMEVGRLLAVLL